MVLGISPCEDVGDGNVKIDILFRRLLIVLLRDINVFSMFRIT